MTDDDLGKRIYEHKRDTDATWKETAAHFDEILPHMTLTPGKARHKARWYYENAGLPAPKRAKAQIRGGMDDMPERDPAELWERAERMEQRREQVRNVKLNRRVTFADGPVVLVVMADLHLGGEGVSYSSIKKDIWLLNELHDGGVNVAVLLCGDLLDNFIVGRLKNLRMNVSPFLAIEEWGLVDYALERLAPYIIGSVAGNHDNWSYALVGVDLLAQRHRELTPGILYDPHELAFVLQVGGYECRVAARHKWKGHSKYNPTHGLEDHHWTRGRDFDIAIAAHTHRGGLAREFDNGGTVGHALVAGSYKKDDAYAMERGFPPPLDTSAVCTVVGDDGILFSTSNLYSLPRLLC